MKILIQTNSQGKLEVIDAATGNVVDVGRVDIYVNSQKRVSAMIEFKDVELRIDLHS